MFSKNEPIFYDVRLQTPHKNVILLTGSGNDLPAFPLCGLVAFGLAQPTPLKSISLRFVGVFKLEFYEVRDNAAVHLVAVREERVLLDCQWSNLLVNASGVLLDESDFSPPASLSPPPSPNTSASPPSPQHPIFHGILHRNKLTGLLLKAKHFNRSHHLSNMVTLSSMLKPLGTPFGELAKLNHDSLEEKTFVLPAGNYELPFHAVIPGDIQETVEGLKGGLISYKMVTCMRDESGHKKFLRDCTVRVFRTLPPETLFLPEALSISNIWPEKIQYMMDLVLKHVAVGASLSVSLKLIPLVKGLRFGKVILAVTEYFTYKDLGNAVYDDNRRVVIKKINPGISDDAYQQYEDDLLRVETQISTQPDPDTQISVQNDAWKVDTRIKMPSTFGVIAQDCDLGSIKVRHKLKVKVQIINRDKHVSELRANLPIIVHISPRETVFGYHGSKCKSEDAIFEGLGESTVPLDSWAPPEYTRHVYDRPLLRNGEPSDMACLSPGDRASSVVSIDELSRVPSYHKALEDAGVGSLDLAPAYEGGSLTRG